MKPCMTALTILAVLALGRADTTPHRADCSIFVLKDCPIANQYAPELQRIIKRYSPVGVHFKLVFEDSDGTQKSAEEHAKTYGFSIPVVLDTKAKIAKKRGVNTSPSVVLTANGKDIYVGRIDDLYPRIGVQRPYAKTHDLRDALDAFLAGKAIKVKKTQAVGCRLY